MSRFSRKRSLDSGLMSQNHTLRYTEDCLGLATCHSTKHHALRRCSLRSMHSMACCHKPEATSRAWVASPQQPHGHRLLFLCQDSGVQPLDMERRSYDKSIQAQALLCVRLWLWPSSGHGAKCSRRLSEIQSPADISPSMQLKTPQQAKVPACRQECCKPRGDSACCSPSIIRLWCFLCNGKHVFSAQAAGPTDCRWKTYLLDQSSY